MVLFFLVNAVLIGGLAGWQWLTRPAHSDLTYMMTPREVENIMGPPRTVLNSGDFVQWCYLENRSLRVLTFENGGLISKGGGKCSGYLPH
jgi:hypothetical protein